MEKPVDVTIAKTIKDIIYSQGKPCSIYVGAEFECRCGCKGKYHQTNTRGFTRALNRALKLDPILVEYNFDYAYFPELLEGKVQCSVNGGNSDKPFKFNWVDVCICGDINYKTITLYWD